MTAKCIYCMLPNQNIRGREHVVSQFLGTFNPDLFLEIVCDDCNTVVFSGLETIFKEDSMEGFIAAQYLSTKNSSIRFRNERLKATLRVEGRETLFANVFPCVEPTTGDLFLRPQIVAEGANGKKQILFLKGVRDSKRFAKRIGWTDAKNLKMYISGSEDEIGELKQELRRRGLNLQENETEIGTGPDEYQFRCKFDATVDTTIERFLAKIAFNYFAFCAIQSRLADLLYEDCFQRIRDFILKGEGTSPVKISSPGLRVRGTEHRPHAPYHIFTFFTAVNRIFVDMSLFGHMRYSVEISVYPFKTIPENMFGKGHIFDISNKKVLRSDTRESVTEKDLSLLRH